MSNVKRRTIVGRHTVRNRVFEVERIEWKNTDGLSFDVYDTATDALLTEESFDDEPGVVDITDLLDGLAEELDAGLLDPWFFDQAQLRTILRRWNGEYGRSPTGNRSRSPAAATPRAAGRAVVRHGAGPPARIQRWNSAQPNSPTPWTGAPPAAQSSRSAAGSSPRTWRCAPGSAPNATGPPHSPDPRQP
jgi:hypothetical protein